MHHDHDYHHHNYHHLDHHHDHHHYHHNYHEHYHHHHLCFLQLNLEVTKFGRAEVRSARVHLDWRVLKPENHPILSIYLLKIISVSCTFTVYFLRMIKYFRSARNHPGWRLSKAENHCPFEKSKLFGI